MRITRRAIVLAAVLLHAVAAVFSCGYFHCDELFQVFELAGYKLGLNDASILPWEFHAGMRPAILPLIVYLFTKGLSIVTDNPFVVAMFVRLFVAMLAVAACVRMLRILERDVSRAARVWLWAATLLAWFAPYLHARFSSENFSAVLFLFGWSFIHRNADARSWFWGGLLLALAAYTRFQVIFLVAGYACWIAVFRRPRLTDTAAALCGGAVALFAGALMDRWLYGTWVFSPWRYVDENLFQGKAAQFGTEPPWYFLTAAIENLVPPFSVLILAAVIVFWIRSPRHYVAWMTIPFVLVHSVVGHKEWRFLFPMVNFVPFMVIAGLSAVRWKRRIAVPRGAARFLVALNCALLLVFALKPADPISYGLSRIYHYVRGRNAVLLYATANPYNNMASLNYFRKRDVAVLPDTICVAGDNVYLYTEDCAMPATVIASGRFFMKEFSNYPRWIRHLDFNGWVGRSGCFSIYRMVGSEPTPS